MVASKVATAEVDTKEEEEDTVAVAEGEDTGADTNQEVSKHLILVTMSDFFFRIWWRRLLSTAASLHLCLRLIFPLLRRHSFP